MDMIKFATELNKVFKLRTTNWEKKCYSPTSQFLLAGKFNKEQIDSMIKLGKEFRKATNY